jgi:hypothetical protein
MLLHLIAASLLLPLVSPFGWHWHSSTLVLRGSEAWQSGADEPGQIGCGVGDFRGVVDERAHFQLGEGKKHTDRRIKVEPLTMNAKSDV